MFRRGHHQLSPNQKLHSHWEEQSGWCPVILCWPIYQCCLSWGSVPKLSLKSKFQHSCTTLFFLLSTQKNYTSIRPLPNERDVSQQSYASTSGPEPSSSNNYQQPSSSSDQVSCPICQSNMKASLINSHLDMCLSRPSTTHTRPDVVAVPERRKPLPKWIYTIMKESELKKKLRELGLSSVGDKATLIARHKAYTILYNAECDAASPRYFYSC